jgi:hypothetical protein
LVLLFALLHLMAVSTLLNFLIIAAHPLLAIIYTQTKK